MRRMMTTRLLVFATILGLAVPVVADEWPGPGRHRRDLPRPVPDAYFRLDIHHQDAEGIAFRHPSDWTVAPDTHGVRLLPPGIEGLEQYRVVFIPAVAALGVTHAGHPRLTAALDRWVLQSFPALERTAEQATFSTGSGDEGTVHQWSGWNADGHEVQLRKFVVLADGDALCLIAAGPRSLLERRMPILEAVAGTLSFSPANARLTPLARDWSRILSGHRLVQVQQPLDSQRPGNDEPVTIALSEDGRFEIANAGASGSTSGSWRIFERNAAAFLELRSPSGTMRYRLEAGQGFTWLDGHPFVSLPMTGN